MKNNEIAELAKSGLITVIYVLVYLTIRQLLAILVPLKVTNTLALIGIQLLVDIIAAFVLIGILRSRLTALNKMSITIKSAYFSFLTTTLLVIIEQLFVLSGNTNLSWSLPFYFTVFGSSLFIQVLGIFLSIFALSVTIQFPQSSTSKKQLFVFAKSIHFRIILGSLAGIFCISLLLYFSAIFALRSFIPTSESNVIIFSLPVLIPVCYLFTKRAYTASQQSFILVIYSFVSTIIYLLSQFVGGILYNRIVLHSSVLPYPGYLEGTPFIISTMAVYVFAYVFIATRILFTCKELLVTTRQQETPQAS